ncbi:MAG: methyltransferase domain-containing protein [Streptosporangiales bacterium]|nr:methyltransferase domain-containing protein [Streptosporangiales bacterium]
MGLTEKVAPRGTRRRKLAAGLARKVRPDRTPPPPPPVVRRENRTLKESWADKDPNALENYLVSGFQNPQVNAQSIIARHHLIRQLFGNRYEDLMRAELEHCVEATKALRRRAKELDVRMGSFLKDHKRAGVLEVSEVIADWQDTYEKEWAAALADRKAKPLSVLEFACGSANDYRYFDSYGIARFLDYTGVDLNDKNVANARRRFPTVNFEVGSVLHLPHKSRSFDYVVAFDIFEHLSLEAMEQAVREACRLAKKGMVLTFFSMVDEPEHMVRPRRKYFWNRLSMPKVRELVGESFASIEVMKIRDLMNDEFGFPYSYNKNAWTFIPGASSRSGPQAG